MKIRMARALTKPVTTERETKRISEPSLRYPAPICSTPVSRVAASRYSRPWFFTRVTMTRAMAPVAALIMPGRPPTKAITTAIQKEAYRPTLGSTPAMIEKAMASGISASATTRPEHIAADIKKPGVFQALQHGQFQRLGSADARKGRAEWLIKTGYNDSNAAFGRRAGAMLRQRWYRPCYAGRGRNAMAA